jgi:glycosyltransferase involved in cell wall biosynthesis
VSPKVSVVTSVYNGEPYFDRAIPGILAQTFDDFEFIVVDDGSTDGTLEKLKELARGDSRVRVFSPGRLGAAAAYNFGVAQASGEYIARQDFDDRSYPDRLRLQAAFLDAHPDVGMVGGSYLLVDEAGSRPGRGSGAAAASSSASGSRSSWSRSPGCNASSCTWAIRPWPRRRY